jgi:hypothetical protein
MIAMLAAGCGGRGTLQFVSLNMTDIDPPAAEVWRFDAGQCYWWADETGELNIVLKHGQRGLLTGRLGDADLGLSLAFDKMPAGSGLNYPIRQQETRTLYLSPLATQRFTSYAGIASVIVRDDRRLRGSFRIWMTPIQEVTLLSFLPQRPGPVLCFGTFEAVEDRARGQAIRDFCESGGWARMPRKAPPVAPRPLVTGPSR